MSSRRVTLLLWFLLALGAGTGCIPIYVSAVEVGLTSGDRLRAIHAQLVQLDQLPPTDDPAQVEFRVTRRLELLDMRRQLLMGPLRMDASIRDRSDTKHPIEDYWRWSPGLYAPVDHELADLKRARNAGVITPAEFDDLSDALTFQARRSIVRRQSEDDGEPFLPGSAQSYWGYSSAIVSTPASRARCATDTILRWRGQSERRYDLNATSFGAWMPKVGGDFIWMVPQPTAARPRP